MKYKNNNTQQAFWIAIGSFFSFGFTIASSMILSRYFSKFDYGTYKQVIYIYTTLLVVFTLGLPKTYSFFLPRVEINEAKNVINKITKILLIFGFLFSIILFFASDFIASILNNSELSYSLKLFSPVPFFMLPTMGLDGILSSFKVTKFMAIYTFMIKFFSFLCIALPVILFDINYEGAIIGFVVSSFISFLLSIYFRNYPLKNVKSEPTSVTYKQIFEFSIPLLFASIWSILMSSSDQFFISHYFGSEVFAEFSNGSTPLPFIDIIITSTAIVLSPVYSKLSSINSNAKDEIFPIWDSVLQKTIKLIYPILIFSCFFSSSILDILYGSKYESAYLYFIIFNFLFFFKIIGYAPFIINIGYTKLYSRVNFYSAILLVVSQIVSIKVYPSPYLLAAISVIVQIIRTIIFLFVISNYLKISVLKILPFKLIFNIIIPSCLSILFVKFYIIDYFEFNSIFSVFIGLLFYLLIFLPYCYFVGINYIEIFKPLLIKIPFVNKFKVLS